MIRVSIARVAGVALFALTASASVGGAQGRGREDANTLSTYRLTMPTIRKVLTASREYDKDPGFQKFKDANPRWMRTLRGMSLAELQVEFEKQPAVKRAITKSGLSSKEWTLAWASMMKAMEQLVYEEVAKAEGKKAPAMPFDTPQPNVDLVRRNHAEIDRLQSGD